MEVATAELRMFEADGRVLWWRVREERAKEAMARCLGEFLATVAERFGQGVGRWDGVVWGWCRGCLVVI